MQQSANILKNFTIKQDATTVEKAMGGSHL
jgi:hypothetical protein